MTLHRRQALRNGHKGKFKFTRKLGKEAPPKHIFETTKIDINDILFRKISIGQLSFLFFKMDLFTFIVTDPVIVFLIHYAANSVPTVCAADF